MAQAATETGIRPSALRQFWERWSGILVPILAVFTALVVGAFIIGITGADWQAAYIGLWEGAFGSPRAFADTVVRSTPFIICGLCVALAFKARLLLSLSAQPCRCRQSFTFRQP